MPRQKTSDDRPQGAFGRWAVTTYPKCEKDAASQWYEWLDLDGLIAAGLIPEGDTDE